MGRYVKDTLPRKIKARLIIFRKRYRILCEQIEMNNKDNAIYERAMFSLRLEVRGYLFCLVDAGIISDDNKSTINAFVFNKDGIPLPDEWGIDLLKKLLLENNDVNAEYPRNK